MDVNERIQLGISFLVRLSLVVAAVFAAVEQNWMVFFISVIVFLLTFLPALIERNYRVYLPTEFELITILFIYATLYLGEVHDYYVRYWWWDSLLHGVSALVFGLIGFLIVYTLSVEEVVSLDMSPGFIFLFSFAFAVMIGTGWEIFEFTMDSWFGLNMQKTGLVDTMWDLIIDALGAFIASWAGYVYLKKGKDGWFARLVEDFVESNPRLFE